jgi:dihydroorotase
MILIKEGGMGWPDLIAKMSTIPCRILGLDRGTLKEGAVADVILIDPDRKWIYTKDRIQSKASNSPFIGKEMTAEVTGVIIGGRIVKKNSEILLNTFKPLAGGKYNV